MKSIHVLVGIDGRDHHMGIDLRGQGKLNQDTMHVGVPIELVDQCDQLSLFGRRRQPIIHRVNAGFGRHFLLGADIDFARRIIADQHRRKTGHDATTAGKIANRILDAGTKCGRDDFAIDQGCGHLRNSPDKGWAEW